MPVFRSNLAEQIHTISVIMGLLLLRDDFVFSLERNHVWSTLLDVIAACKK